VGSVERTAEILRRCQLVVSNDTGVMHLAAAMGTPTVGLFGPNTPQRYAPVGPRALAVYTTRVPCSPCIHVHHGIIPDCTHPETGRCMLDVDVDAVVAAAAHLLAACRDLETCDPTGSGP
jgi:lipopolysaccharide heptosyltransferase II